MISFLNHKPHPEDKTKKYFFYKNEKAFIEMKRLLDENNISYIDHKDAAPTYYIVIEKKDFDQTLDFNAEALAKYKQPLIPDTFARYFLIGLLVIAFVIALIGYIKENY